jgi:hypothetical protein
LPITGPQHAPAILIDLGTVRKHHRAAERTRAYAVLWTAAADIPVLLAEIGRLESLLTLARVRQADLTGAVRATIAAERDGEDDPLWYVRDELAANGALPPPWLSAPDLLTLADLADSEEAAR